MNMNDLSKKTLKDSCRICKKVFEGKIGLSRHLRTMHTAPKHTYKCNICNISFLKLSSLNIHRHIHNGNTNVKDCKEVEVKKRKISEVYTNVVSETLYSSDSDCEYELLQTVIKVNSTRNCTYTCQYCNKMFTRKNNLKRHVFNKHRNEPVDAEMESYNTEDMQIDNVETAEDKMQVDDSDVQEIITIKTSMVDSHSNDKKYYCTSCNVSFQDLSQLTNHRKVHLKQLVLKFSQNTPHMPFNKKYRCQLCRRSYSQKIYYENHMRLHENGKVYEIFDDPLDSKYLCVTCGKLFTSSSHLSAHKRLHVDGKKYLCNFCGKSFTLERYLTNHEKMHSQEKLFRCEFCDKRFIHKGNLIEHLRIHSGVKPHECTICNKKFTQYSGLTQHLQTHTDEKKYNCKACGKSFRFSGHYKGHLRTHTGDKPFACAICDRKFALSGSLVVHYRTHSGDRPFKCETCKKCFIKSYNLKQHLKRHNSCKGKFDSGEKKNAELQIDVQNECILRQ